MNIKLRWLFAYLAFFILFAGLGVWQIHRANVKQNFLDTEAQRMNEQVKLNDVSSPNIDLLRYEQATVDGHYDTTKQILLDNQINAGKAGYFVFTPFKLKNSDKTILVNRGWIPLIEPRSSLPNVDFSANSEITLKGRLNAFPSIGWKLEGANQPTETNPAVVGVLDSEILAQKLGYALFDFQLELSPDAMNGFKREWAVAKIMQPEQHLAYALQWFGFALVLTILFFKLGVKKI